MVEPSCGPPFGADDTQRARARQSDLFADGVAFTFGLLHGLGFAGGLSEAGLPQGHVPLALLFFSLGVELSHFAFIATVAALIVLGRRPLRRFRTTLGPQQWALIRLVPPYAIGGTATFWLIQRLATF